MISSSLSQSANISAAILNCTSASPYLDSALSLLVLLSANRPDWSDIKDIDVPIQQRKISRAIDQASFDLLLHDYLPQTPVPRPWHYPPLSIMLVTG